MIRYKRGGRWHLFNIFLIRGSVFPASFLMAGPPALIAFMLKWYDIVEDTGDLSVLLNSAVWSGFSSLVGFLVVFRTSQAYSRFWDGCSATHQMRAEWIDAASAMMAFCHFSSAEADRIVKFKHLLVRLFSLLHAMALGEIEEDEESDGRIAFDLELIDPSGLDTASWKSLLRCHNKTTLVFTWLQTMIVDNIKTGVLSIPPPILSRVFQELANGMIALHEAQKIAHIPFPFPYAQTCDALLFLHWIITPLVTAQWASNAWAAGVFGFVQVFILWSLNNIAVEIEHPFGSDANDLDASEMQMEMNMNLLLVLDDAATCVPHLSHGARIHDLTKAGRRASQSISELHEESTYNDIMSSCVVGHRRTSQTTGTPFSESSSIPSQSPSTFRRMSQESSAKSDSPKDVEAPVDTPAACPALDDCANPHNSLPISSRVSDSVQPDPAFGGTSHPQHAPAADIREGSDRPPEDDGEQTGYGRVDIERGSDSQTSLDSVRGPHACQIRPDQAGAAQCQDDQGGAGPSRSSRSEQINSFQEGAEQSSVNQAPAHSVRGPRAEPIREGEAQHRPTDAVGPCIVMSASRREVL
mmetsp:Transcript_24050/g.56859  ORF Transcript_24050/g.56859 Transcript_24050/m.56859 type:complete len:583 (+) Transcript_24050:141-1889(+)